MKISINSVNFLEFFASFLYDTGKLFRFEKSRHFQCKNVKFLSANTFIFMKDLSSQLLL